MVSERKELLGSAGGLSGKQKLSGSIRGVQDETGSFIDGRTARQTSWQMTILIILADTVGTGVLSLSAALAQLGWGIGLACLFISIPIFWFAGYLVMHCHLAIPSSRTYGDVGAKLLGPFGRILGYVVVYGIGFTGMSGYALVIAQNIQGLFYDVHLCLPECFLIAFFIIFPGNQCRTLHNITILSFLSFAALLIVVVIAIVFLFSDGASCNGSPPDALNYYGFFGSLGSFIWAYAGISYYLEMLAEMKHPEEFAQKSGTGALALATSLYFVTILITYSKCGEHTPESVVSVIPDGPWKRIASVLMIFHIMVTYAINNQVTIRGFFCATGWYTGLESSVKGHIVWAIISSVITGLAMMLTMAIPQFDNFTGLIGNFCAAGCMLLPGLFFLLVQSQLKTWEQSSLRTVVMALCWPMMLLGIIFLVLGMQASIHQIIEDSKTDMGKPFGCAPLNP